MRWCRVGDLGSLRLESLALVWTGPLLGVGDAVCSGGLLGLAGVLAREVLARLGGGLLARACGVGAIADLRAQATMLQCAHVAGALLRAAVIAAAAPALVLRR